jgi:hypothetical protein
VLFLCALEQICYAGLTLASSASSVSNLLPSALAIDDPVAATPSRSPALNTEWTFSASPRTSLTSIKQGSQNFMAGSERVARAGSLAVGRRALESARRLIDLNVDQVF